MLLDCCPVLSVCNVGVLWPNGWMDQDETHHRDTLHVNMVTHEHENGRGLMSIAAF